MKRFLDRRQAGRLLARELAGYAGRREVIVLALPRGGVPVGYEVATALGAPLDVFTVRKLGAPWNEEYAIGALASGGIRLVDRAATAALGVTANDLERLTARETVELERRERVYRGNRPFPDLEGRIVILVDDGLATGATMRAAIEAVDQRKPARVIAAAPVASREACSLIRETGARCECVATPEPFLGVGMWYEDFSQTTDAEVIALLERANAPGARAAS
jgi:predicted phosphoribosyltransferase